MKEENPSITAKLKSLTQGLTYQSESDFPVKPFFMKGGDKRALKASDVVGEKKPVKQIDFDEFFRPVTDEQDWYGPEETKTAKRFQELVQSLRDNLTDIKVFKAGKVKMDVYVVGRTAAGDFAGVSTTVVET